MTTIAPELAEVDTVTDEPKLCHNGCRRFIELAQCGAMNECRHPKPGQCGRTVCETCVALYRKNPGACVVCGNHCSGL